MSARKDHSSDTWPYLVGQTTMEFNSGRGASRIELACG